MIEVEVDSEDAALRLAGLAAHMIDFRPFWPLATRLVRTWFEQQFHSEGAWSGESWAPLSPVYGAWKAAHHPGKQILELTGFMEAHVTGRRGPRPVPKPQEISYVIDDPKSAWHQHGTTRMPARRIVPETIPPGDLLELGQLAEQWVEGVIADWGFGPA